ncbi:Retrovirus-related Pol polyprotein from transposon TNT 1-94 [Pseudolycoriella hygida]|uniref:Retrovirus-related Pol polyprotein from transposon TNT 1-94 n=1 Tax=Pseudolycoriella hygida TaxID=35572 RepID=A0A9Q0S8S5_9DIPT|nr:Retrovirus-related Pol polyprotein from transposon TNT 1-94 [Pseudolycoriella hygida]
MVPKSNFDKLDKCIKSKPNLPNVSTENEVEKLVQAKSILCLSVEDSIIVHIRNANSALHIWNILQNLYEDKGLLRKTGLLRALMSVRLESSASMAAYVEEIMNISNRLLSIGFEIGDEWLASILLAGLTDDYKPFIMSIEGSGVQISSDMVKQKLIDSEITDTTNSQADVLFTNKKSNQKPKKKELICYNCGKKNHKASECRNKASGEQPLNHQTTAKTVRTSAVTNTNKAPKRNAAFVAFSMKSMETKRNDDWYVDSGSARNMSPNGDSMYNKAKCEIKEVMTADDSIIVLDDTLSSPGTVTYETGESRDGSYIEVDETFDDSVRDPNYEPNESSGEEIKKVYGTLMNANDNGSSEKLLEIL